MTPGTVTWHDAILSITLEQRDASASEDKDEVKSEPVNPQSEPVSQ